jgi:putative tricarboxylic transport membrane protein
MRSRDIFSSLFWMLVGVGICWGGYDMKLGTLHNPGSGFIFFWVGVIIVVLSLIILIQAIGREPTMGEMKSLLSGIGWKKIIPVLLALFLYGYAFLFLGFILCTVLVLIFLFKIVEPQKWSIAIIGAILSSLSAYLVFQVWLGSQLPKGILNIG